jgi:hypothetical protein
MNFLNKAAEAAGAAANGEGGEGAGSQSKVSEGTPPSEGSQVC